MYKKESGTGSGYTDCSQCCRGQLHRDGILADFLIRHKSGGDGCGTDRI